MLKKFGHQPNTKTSDVFVGANSSFVIVKPDIRIKPCHTHVDARHTCYISWIRVDELFHAQDFLGQFDDIDVVFCAHSGEV